MVVRSHPVAKAKPRAIIPLAAIRVRSAAAVIDDDSLVMSAASVTAVAMTVMTVTVIVVIVVIVVFVVVMG